MDEKEYSPLQIVQDNVLMGFTIWSVSSVLKIIHPVMYVSYWIPWLWVICIVWGACEGVIITKTITGWKNKRNAIKPLSAEELLYKEWVNSDDC